MTQKTRKGTLRVKSKTFPEEPAPGPMQLKKLTPLVLVKEINQYLSYCRSLQDNVNVVTATSIGTMINKWSDQL